MGRREPKIELAPPGCLGQLDDGIVVTPKGQFHISQRRCWKVVHSATKMRDIERRGKTQWMRDGRVLRLWWFPALGELSSKSSLSYTYLESPVV